MTQNVLTSLRLKRVYKVLVQKLKAAKAGHLPTIKIEDTYSRFKYDYANPAWDNDSDRQNTVQLSLQWKIFDFGSTSASVQAAQKKLSLQKQ